MRLYFTHVLLIRMLIFLTRPAWSADYPQYALLPQITSLHWVHLVHALNTSSTKVCVCCVCVCVYFWCGSSLNPDIFELRLMLYWNLFHLLIDYFLHNNKHFVVYSEVNSKMRFGTFLNHHFVPSLTGVLSHNCQFHIYRKWSNALLDF